MLRNQLPKWSEAEFLKRTVTGVLRYWNNDILTNMDGVLEDIHNAITRTPTPNPSPQGGGEQGGAGE